MWTESPIGHHSMRKQVIFCQVHSGYPNVAQFYTRREKHNNPLILDLLPVLRHKTVPPTAALDFLSQPLLFKNLTTFLDPICLKVCYADSEILRKGTTVPLGNVPLSLRTNHLQALSGFIIYLREKKIDQVAHQEAFRENIITANHQLCFMALLGRTNEEVFVPIKAQNSEI